MSMSSTDSAIVLYDKLQSLLAEGKESEAQEYLVAHLSELPEEMQGEIMLEMFADGLDRVASALERHASDVQLDSRKNV